ncbi:hypothetical protein PACTADRAFT_49335 [Pachysolen tannophilus NRRL Y-2460]|uniref:Pyruvate decarboxylase n=1 Tax=Pachysolen tannophilus NRRL Y-2460 TaxID=669874 RepID=A0A1E4TW60_PACTA|nr:hypothetical protein PACTADRAFT_49335 [Pachysolen tannophilus NRRL Y-2460]
MTSAVAFNRSGCYSLSYEPEELHFNDEITISEYIYRRILQLGVRHIFGVPGDYCLDFCEEINKVPDLKWVGTCNELNGAYAADGYGKMSENKIGVFVSAFGVGELSAINGISGAFAEYSPILHIVGTSSRQQKQKPYQMHHLIPTQNKLEPDHYVYEKMVEPICVVKESLHDVSNACSQIDNAIEKIWQHSRPGYLYLPSDMATAKIPAERLTSYSLNLKNGKDDDDLQLVEKIAGIILEKLYKSEKTVIISDYLIRPFRQQEKVQCILEKLIDKVNLVTTTMGKGFIDEDSPRFCGVYAGAQSPLPQTNMIVENDSDLVISIGTFEVQGNTGNYTTKIPREKLISMSEFYCTIGENFYQNVSFVNILSKINEKLDSNKVLKSPHYSIMSEADSNNNNNNNNNNSNIDIDSEALSLKFLIKSLQDFLKPNDLIVIETCTFMFAFLDLKFKPGQKVLSQLFYNSIGYALPATLGASLALRDLGLESTTRVILIQGDGSAMTTVQELTTYLRQDITPTVLLLNNDGYTVERIIKGPNSVYNDVAPHWQWTKLFQTFGDYNAKSFNAKIETCGELTKHFNNPDFATGKRLQFLELILDRLDAPDFFKSMFDKK